MRLPRDAGPGALDRYFDWAATSPPEEDIIAEAAEIAGRFFANPSSAHGEGKRAREKLEEARSRAALALGVNPGTLVFTSGGTEGDQFPFLSLLSSPAKTGRILYTELEHPAVSAMAESLGARGWTLTKIRVNREGIVTEREVLSALTEDTRLVCVTAVSNETGAIQPVGAIAGAITEFFGAKRRAKFHVDAVQGAGKIPLAIGTPGIDSAAFSAHKIGGPRGVGLLYLARGADSVESLLKGGGQEGGARSGTENLAGAWALSRCLEKFYMRIQKDTNQPETQVFERLAQQRAWTGEFIQALRAIPGCTLAPPSRKDGDPAFSPWIVRAAFGDIPGGVMQRALDGEGFAVSTGSACSSRKPESALAPVRFSFGHGTTKQGMEALLDALRGICL
ncbi:MAG: cysteine desulfurase [Spirochaetaceae bacterium]|jgi:cysteine desulfurase|nr:cysteine desulfurase [Spirochaetaceae bacterium]